MPFYVRIIGLIISAVGLAVFWLCLSRRKPMAVSPIVGVNYKDISKAKREKQLSRRPPLWFDIVQNVLCVVMLATIIIVFVVVKPTVSFNTEWIFFFLFWVGLPLLLLADAIIIEPKQYAKGRSCGWQDNEFTAPGDIDSIFDRCLKVLDMMNTIRITVNRPKIIEVWQQNSARGNHIITVTVNRKGSKEHEARIHVESDSQLMTAKWDFLHGNRENVHTFERLIRAEGNGIGRKDKSNAIKRKSKRSHNKEA